MPSPPDSRISRNDILCNFQEMNILRGFRCHRDVTDRQLVGTQFTVGLYSHRSSETPKHHSRSSFRSFLFQPHSFDTWSMIPPWRLLRRPPPWRLLRWILVLLLSILPLLHCDTSSNQCSDGDGDGDGADCRGSVFESIDERGLALGRFEGKRCGPWSILISRDKEPRTTVSAFKPRSSWLDVAAVLVVGSQKTKILA
jgi:hypothetical protein